ncbi:MAG: sigma-70 family RNA polymerase sigma factor, partial [Gemmobacter sp.]|nr:sigma-70 family RNA polymerase sigma factor [Gemmobacter sp.]
GGNDERQTRSSPAGPEDWTTLLRAANAGDAVAYATFLRVVAPVLRGVVRARGLGSLGEATCEDIVQEVLLAIHLKRHTWRDEDPVRPWLYAIARYKVVDAFRARGRRIEVPVEDFAEILPAPDTPDPTERSDMDKIIGMLDPRAADIVRGIGLNGDSFAETGKRLGMTEGAVRVALHRGLKRLAALRERHVK